MSDNFIAPDILKCFEQGIEEVFQVQLGSKLYSRVHSGRPPAGEIVSYLSLLSTTREGGFGLFFPSATVLAIYNRLAGEENKVLADEHADAASEILNITYGVSRTKINQLGHDFYPAIPALIRGTNICLSQTGLSLAYLAYECDLGVFQVQLGMKVRSEKK